MNSTGFHKKSSVVGQLSLFLSLAVIPLALTTFTPVVSAEGLNHKEKTDKEAAKNSNVAEAQKLNGTAPADGAAKQKASDTAKAVNQVPGVKVQKEDLEPPTEAPIKGFHPIKKLLRPVENLEGMSIKLEQQIMKLEGPIAALQPPMLSLQKKMTGVDDEIGQMQTRLDSMQSQVTGVRSDLASMRKEISELKAPIVSLQKPIAGVATPLEDLNAKLNYILMAIIIAAVAIALGTPFAAVMVYRNRAKLFPNMNEHDMPKVSDGKEPISNRR